MKNYLVICYFASNKGPSECSQLLEALAPSSVWSVIDPNCCTFLMRFDLSAPTLGKQMIVHFHPNDKLLIMEVSDNNAWYGLTPHEIALRYLGPFSLDLAS